MKSYVWTYRNKKPIGAEFERYYYVKNQDELDEIIEEFLYIDAVTTPSDLEFPVILELENGFAPSFVEVSKEALGKELKKLQKLVEKAEKKSGKARK